ncbi:MAG: pseudouridine synthase [Caldimonas sp.]
MIPEIAMGEALAAAAFLDHGRPRTSPFLHVDEHCIVAVKPHGLLSVQGRGEGGLDCFAARVQAVHADALVVHRLDMATSGLMVFARGALAQRRLSDAFAKREVTKRYIAVVAGHVADDEGEIDLPLYPDWPNRPRQVVDRVNGKACLTRFRVLSRARDPGTTRVELQPVTGRSHQLRVHLQAIGHPILGDALYAGDAVESLAPRLLLHAASLHFAHPIDGAPIACESPAPF